MKAFALLLVLVCHASFASDGLELNTSVSQAYESRSLLINPAALGFQTELNGAGLYYAYAHGFEEGRIDQATSSLSFGYFGLGMERLEKPLGRQHRYTLGVGIPVGPYWYFGTRYRFTSSDIAALDRLSSLDLGAQIRPHRNLSIGLLANGINRPLIAGVEQPPEYAISATLRAFNTLDLSADLLTPEDRFMQNFQAQVLAGAEVYRGLRLFAGFHTERKWLAGLQLNIGVASLFSSGYAGNAGKAMVAGLQISTIPYRSSWMPETALKVKVDDDIGEAHVRGGILGKDRPSFWQLLDQLHKAEKRDDVKKVVVRLQDFNLGLGAAQDLYDALWKVRSAGKRIEIYLESTDLREYLIASAAHRIVLAPSADIRFTGLRSQRYFFKGPLDKIGVEGEFYAKGEYKSAPESFTRKSSTEISRGETMKQLKTAEDLLVSLIAKTRKFSPKDWERYQREGIIGAARAKELGLVDDIARYPNDFEKTTKGLLVRSDLKEISESLAIPRKIAIIVARGSIMQQEIRALSFAGEAQLTPERMEKQFQRATSDPYTDAIVMRVSSPGGEVLASDEIAGSVQKARETKPVVVSMGDVAASGGYFIAAPASQIYAQPLTLTGSIGVFLGKFSTKKLYEKIELNKEVLTHGPYPGLLSEDRPWSEPERKVMVKRLEEYYGDFVGYVAKSRNIKTEEAEKAAKGRVYFGDEAKALRVIDDTKGYVASVESAAKLAGLEDGEYTAYLVQEKSGLVDLFGDDGPLVQMPEPIGGLVKGLSQYSLLGSQTFLYWCPTTLN